MSKAKAADTETSDKARARKATPAKAKGKAAPAAAAKKPAAKKPAAKPAEKPAAKAAAAKKPAAKKPAAKPAEVVEAAAVVDAAELASPELAHFAEAPEAEPEALDAARDPLEDEDEDALAERVLDTAEALAAGEVEPAAPTEEPEPEPARELSPEEQELAAIYGEEMTGGALATTEYRDHRTADEDRPMVPEINAREERQKRWDDRRRKRRERRDERQQRAAERRDGRPPQRDEHGGGRPHEGRPGNGAAPAGEARGGNGHDRPAPAQLSLPAPAVAAPAAAAGEGVHAVHRVGNQLGDAAWALFTQLRSSQPLPVKQLAAMMRKRGLLDVDPEQSWPHLKAALIGDERSYRQLGLRPRIVYRGRDLFAPGPMATSSTSGVESALAAALSQLAVATHTALKERIGRASPNGFERIVHAYLVSTGYEDIEWVKRVGGISYATAMPPDGGSAILVSARSGDGPVDRRGVGELRVGVEAKQMLAGLLLSARELSEEAERELVRPGRSIMVLCGDAFIGALIGAGVGVVTTAAPLRYVDDQLLDELLAG